MIAPERLLGASLIQTLFPPPAAMQMPKPPPGPARRLPSRPPRRMEFDGAAVRQPYGCPVHSGDGGQQPRPAARGFLELRAERRPRTATTSSASAISGRTARPLFRARDNFSGLLQARCRALPGTSLTLNGAVSSRLLLMIDKNNQWRNLRKPSLQARRSRTKETKIWPGWSI